MKKIIALAAVFFAVAYGQQKGSFTDKRDGKTYATVKIGNQTWMTENLDFDDGVSSICDPVKPNDPKKCKYGRWYNWATAMNIDTSFNYKQWGNKTAHKGLCPDGWHIPSNAEWEQLVKFAGGKDIAGKKLKSNIWTSEEVTELKQSLVVGKSSLSPMQKLMVEEAIFKLQQLEGSNDFGFSALPGGHVELLTDGLSLLEVGEAGYWWTATEGQYHGYDKMLNKHKSDAYFYILSRSNNEANWNNYQKNTMLNIRCINDLSKTTQIEESPNRDMQAQTIYSGRCTAITKSGHRCERNAGQNGKCWQHQ